MQQSKWYALLFLVGAFVAGTAVGVAGDRAMEHNRPMSRGGGSRSPLDRMSRDLDLTPAQRAAFVFRIRRRNGLVATGDGHK